jgi:hypothetical protein
MAEMTPHAVRMLYRSMLRAAARYPSVKRETIYQTIRESEYTTEHHFCCQLKSLIFDSFGFIFFLFV